MSDKFEIYSINISYALRKRKCSDREAKIVRAPSGYRLYTFFDRVKHASNRIQCSEHNILSICNDTHNLYGFGIYIYCIFFSKSRQLNISNVNEKSRLTHFNSEQHKCKTHRCQLLLFFRRRFPIVSYHTPNT